MADISKRIWIFQANPKRYKIIEALADEKIKEIHWSVNQHKKEIVAGDIGIIWLSGKKAGIYAITKITTNPRNITESEIEKKYWIDEGNEKGERFRVRMKIEKKLWEKPLFKEIITNTSGLQAMKIIRNPRGTNFEVTQNEWNIIDKLISQQY